MTQIQRRIFAILSRLGGEEVARLLTDYHGTQLLDGCFGDFLVEEGVAEREDIFDKGDSEEDEE
jgi:hypothetical protein